MLSDEASHELQDTSADSRTLSFTTKINVCVWRRNEIGRYNKNTPYIESFNVSCI